MSKSELKIYLVIPTIRDLFFLKKWKNEFKDCHLMVIEDRNNKTVGIPNVNFKSITHFSWKDINNDLGKNSWIISRHNAGIRSYGFWKAYEAGADVILTVDDDCYPADSRFVQKHIDNLFFKYPEKWINTYPNPKWMYTRGTPYRMRDKGTISLSHGLWSGALDLDGLVEIKLPRLLKEGKYPPIRQVLPFGYYYPMCSMNMAFTREITPLMFFPMMGMAPSGRDWPYNRFDDIWAGIFSKKIMDHLGLGVINGSPFINHKKASKPSENHIKELSAMSVNETIWRLVDAVKLTAKTPKGCYLELARKVKFPSGSYFTKLKKAMVLWSNLF